MKKSIFDSARLKRCLTFLLWGAVVAQFCYIAWVCLTQWPTHLDPDASGQLLKAMRIAQASSVSLSGWFDSTNLLLDTPLTLAAPFYLLFRNIFVAYGVAVFCLDILLAVLLFLLLRQCGSVPAWCQALALLFVFCPYGAGIWLSYANCTMVQSGHYLVRVIFFVWLLLSILILHRQPWSFVCRPGVLLPCLLLLALSAWIGLSSGTFLLLLLVVPALLFYLWCILATRQYGQLHRPAMVFLLGVLAAMCSGLWAQHHIIGFYGRDRSIRWIGYQDFSDNLNAVFQGYCKLLGALPQKSNIPVLSVAGILVGISFALAILLLAGLFFAIRRGVARGTTAPLSKRFVLGGLLSCIATFNILICLFASLTYGDEVYEARYLLFAALAMMLLVAIYLPHVQLPGDLSPTFCGVIVCFVLLNVIWQDMQYTAPYYDYSLAQKVTDTIAANYPNVQVVYMASDDPDRRILRVADPGREYYSITSTPPSMDYGTYRDGNDLVGGTLLLCTDAQYQALGTQIQSRYQKTDLGEFWLYFDKAGISTAYPGAYALYYCPDGGIDLNALLAE